MARMCSLDPIEYGLSKLSNVYTAIEVGTYYGGWTGFLAQHFDQVISFQSPDTNKLNHVGVSTGEFSEEGLKWKELMKQRLPIEYQDLYSFDYLAELVSSYPNVMQILHTSPPNVSFPYTFDLCTIDISRDPKEHLKQYSYWKNKGNNNSIILMGIYQPREYDNFSITQRQFLDSIEHSWHFYPQDNRYILIEL
jgi:hypothetical protein